MECHLGSALPHICDRYPKLELAVPGGWRPGLGVVGFRTTGVAAPDRLQQSIESDAVLAAADNNPARIIKMTMQARVNRPLIENLQGFVGENLSLLTPVDLAWQPTDFLPDLTAADWSEQLERFRETALRASDELLVILVGNMITEEALPNYSISLEHTAKDPTGTTDTPWAHWLRGWTAEENRHGDLLNAYLRLTGRVDLRSVEVTVHHLIRNGFKPSDADDDYSGIIYAAFQERATRISHGNVAQLAARQGEENLARICRKIAADETRHETFYTRVMREVMEREPEEGVLAYRAMIKGLVAMPGKLMFDGNDAQLFDHFAAVAQRTGVYTARTYGEIIAHLNEAWEIGHLSVSGKAAKAQEYLAKQPERYELLADEIAGRVAAQPPTSFAWIHGRQA
jgi:acyl-[acyl-carrier-protein] desaturase